VIGPAVAVSVSNEKDIGRIGNPDPPVSDGDAAGDIETFEKYAGFVYRPIPIGVFENTNAVLSGARLAPGVFKGLGDPVATTFVDGHGNGVDHVGFCGDEFDREALGDCHFCDGFGGAERWSGGTVLSMRDAFIGGD
jgi:hypothetical protein